MVYSKHQYRFLALIFFFTLIASDILAQKILPDANVELEGEEVNLSSFGDKKVPTLLFFVEKWSSTCKHAIEAMEKEIQQWHDSYGLEIAILSSAPRNGVTPDFLEWMESCPFTVYLDDGSAKRAMGVNNVPHLFLTNNQGHITWQLISWSTGDEEKIANALEAMEH